MLEYNRSLSHISQFLKKTQVPIFCLSRSVAILFHPQDPGTCLPPASREAASTKGTVASWNFDPEMTSDSGCAWVTMPHSMQGSGNSSLWACYMYSGRKRTGSWFLPQLPHSSLHLPFLFYGGGTGGSGSKFGEEAVDEDETWCYLIGKTLLPSSPPSQFRVTLCGCTGWGMGKMHMCRQN
jgi:hypothetical protein